MVGPKKVTSNVCWCLSYRRLPPGMKSGLDAVSRAAYVEQLCTEEPAPGVLAYDGDDVAGWAAVAPRSATSFSRSRVIPHLDDLPVWSVWCLRVRPGYRGRGLAHALIEGAVAFAEAHGAPVVEAGRRPATQATPRIRLTSTPPRTLTPAESA